MRHRWLAAGLSLLLVLVGSYTIFLRGQVDAPPSFHAGGTWAPTATEPAEEPMGEAPGPSAPDTHPPTPAPVDVVPSGPVPERSENPSILEAEPAVASQTYRSATQGSYRYSASGSEAVEVGAFSACGWELDEVGLVIHEETEGFVLDWTYNRSHQERHLARYDPSGLMYDFVGARISCGMAPPQTSEGTYDPPVPRFAFPLEVGNTWGGESTAGGRGERFQGTVLRRETVAVPAGSFDAYVVRFQAEFYGNATGSSDRTFWYVPERGIWVKELGVMTARQSGATFVADYAIELSEFPG